MANLFKVVPPGACLCLQPSVELDSTDLLYGDGVLPGGAPNAVVGSGNVEAVTLDCLSEYGSAYPGGGRPLPVYDSVRL